MQAKTCCEVFERKSASKNMTPIPILQVLASSLVCSDLVGLMVEKSTDALYRMAANETSLVFEPSLLAASSLLYMMSHLEVSSEVSTVRFLGIYSTRLT